MPYAERSTPSSARHMVGKATSLPMPVAAMHNNEERYIPSLQSFVRRKCVEYFTTNQNNEDDDDDEYYEDDESYNNDGRVGLRCTFCKHIHNIDEKAAKSYIYPRQTASIQASVLTIQYSHIPFCTEVPEEVIEHMEVLKNNDYNKERMLVRKKKRYRWADVAHEMGFTDIKDDIVVEEEEEAAMEEGPSKRVVSSGQKRGIIFIPPEETIGRNRKRKAVLYADDDTYADDYYSDASSIGMNIPTSLPPPKRRKRQPQPKEVWTEEHDIRLWNGQEQLGNRWKDMSDIIFMGKFHSDQVRNRWYSQPFKDYIASKFGKGAYNKAHTAGRQVNSSGGRGSYSAPPPKKSAPARSPIDWDYEMDMKLWNTQNELGNRWKDIAAKLGKTGNVEHIKSRWYSDKFKEFVANEFGKTAYKTAHINGRQDRAGAKPQVDWTEEDDVILWQARQDYGNKWEDIATEKFKNRISANHVKNRWYSQAFKKFVAKEYGPNAYQNAKIDRRGATVGARPQVDWAEEDDVLLWQARQDHGNKWEDIATEKFKNRISENHIKNRWYSQAFKKFVAKKYGPNAYEHTKIGRRGAVAQINWTREGDTLLWKTHEAIGNKWAEMTEMHFKAMGINENQVKNRWYSAPFKKFVAEEFGSDAHRNAKHRK